MDLTQASNPFGEAMIRFYSSGNGFHTSKDGVKTPFDISKTGMTWPNFKEAINDWGLYWKFVFKDDYIVIYSPRGKHGELRKE